MICPACKSEVHWAATRCPNCLEEFEGTSMWRWNFWSSVKGFFGLIFILWILSLIFG